MVPAHAPVELEFDYGPVSAPTLRKWTSIDQIQGGIKNNRNSKVFEQ